MDTVQSLFVILLFPETLSQEPVLFYMKDILCTVHQQADSIGEAGFWNEFSQCSCFSGNYLPDPKSDPKSESIFRGY
jgi:hypothetical protein